MLVTAKIKNQVNLIFNLLNEYDEKLSGHLGIYPPRSKARDYNGFSQAFIAKLIKGESMRDEKNNLLKLFNSLREENLKILLHNEGKNHKKNHFPEKSRRSIGTL